MKTTSRVYKQLTTSLRLITTEVVKAHRPPNESEARFIRRVAVNPLTAEGTAVSDDQLMKLGVRVFPEFVSLPHSDEVVKESLEIVERLGISHVTGAHREVYLKQMAHLSSPPDVAMLRLTGVWTRRKYHLMTMLVFNLHSFAPHDDAWDI